MKEATKEFRDKSLKIRNDFVDVLQEKLKQVDTEELKDILGRDIYRVREENDRMLQEVRASEGFMTFVWYIAYGLPYILSIGLFIGLYEWIRARFHD